MVSGNRNPNSEGLHCALENAVDFGTRFPFFSSLFRFWSLTSVKQANDILVVTVTSLKVRSYLIRLKLSLIRRLLIMNTFGPLIICSQFPPVPPHCLSIFHVLLAMWKYKFLLPTVRCVIWYWPLGDLISTRVLSVLSGTPSGSILCKAKLPAKLPVLARLWPEWFKKRPNCS